jgi:hypothetical protein
VVLAEKGYVAVDEQPREPSEEDLEYSLARYGLARTRP